MKTIEDHIMTDNQAICENIEDLEFKTREKVAQNMLGYFRNLVEHIAVKIYSENHEEAYIDYDTIPKAMEALKIRNEYFFLRKFHRMLQESRSHYTPDNEEAERLLLKYFEYLLQIKDFMKQKYQMEILQNIEKFPLDLDDTIQSYYEKVVEKIALHQYATGDELYSERFYVLKTKAFFVNRHVYYENTLIPVNDESSKFNRIVVFSASKITVPYAIKVKIEDDIIEISDRFMPIKILSEWYPSIRPCELKNFAKLFGMNIEIQSSYSEYIRLMNFISKTGLNLVEIMECSDERYHSIRHEITEEIRTVKLFNVFDEARKWIIEERYGSNTVRYLAYCLNNKVIKCQLDRKENYRIKGLYISYRALPFEEMPFATSLVEHNPSIYDLLSCISVKDREHELLARQIKSNTEKCRKLYTKKEELGEREDIQALLDTYNKSLYIKHQGRKIERFGENYFIKEYEDDTKEIIQILISLTKKGIDHYAEGIKDWLAKYEIDCKEKENIMLNMFQESRLAMIYGAAGTGKSTLIKHISKFWKNKRKVYIANTHSAVENLRRKTEDREGEFLTIKKFISSSLWINKIDILFIDECSMAGNRDILEILRRRNYVLLVLVGDIYQIEAIQFGNWFSLARYFVPFRVQYELTELYRTKSKYLKEFWKRVRNYQDDISEWMGYCGYSSMLNESIFEPVCQDEIILCLNYDGIYGINNINRFLQSANSNKVFHLGVWTYKIGDRVLFNDSSKYDSILYNNLKGVITNIEEDADKLIFTIEVDQVLEEQTLKGTDIQLMPQKNENKSVVRFAVYKKKEGDDDTDDRDADTNIPFQIAYAVSIHKAQGLEYDSVKIIITREVDELISHSIFYTAITRARKKLKIYWTPESQQKILNSFADDETSYDAKIFSARTGLKIVKRKKRK